MRTKSLLISVTAVVVTLFSAIPAQAGLDFWRKTDAELAGRSRILPMQVPSEIRSLIREASKQTGVDANLLEAVAFRESAFNTRAVSRRGAQGLMQLMPRTAKFLGVTDAFDARQNIIGGAKYLKMMLDQFDGNVDLALAAYNAGPEAVKKKGLRATTEAVEYVAAIRSYYQPSAR